MQTNLANQALNDKVSCALPVAGHAPQRRRISQRGLTLIEVLIVIAIGAGMLFGVFTVANRINDRSTINELASNLNMMAAETRSAFRAQGNYGGPNPVSAAALIGMGIPPTTIVNGTGPTATIQSPWNTAIAVAPVTLTAPDDSVGFTITGVPRAQCAALVSAAEGAFGRVLIGAVVVKNMTSLAPAMTPLNAGLVGTTCNAAGPFSIQFILGR